MRIYLILTIYATLSVLAASAADVFKYPLSSASSRTIASNPERIHLTREILEIITKKDDSYSLSLALSKSHELLALQVSEDGQFLDSKRVSINEDYLYIYSKQKELVFALSIDLDISKDSQNSDSTQEPEEDIWVSIFSAPSEFGLSERENFRIFNIINNESQEKEYRVYRYQSQSLTAAGEKIIFNRSSPTDKNVKEIAQYLNEKMGVNIPLPYQVEMCLSPYDCAYNALVEKSFKGILQKSSISLESQNILEQHYKQCLVEKDYLLKVDKILIVKKDAEKDLIKKTLEECLIKSSFEYGYLSIEEFLEAKFLHIPEGAMLPSWKRQCLVSNKIDEQRVCLSDIEKIQLVLSGTQPSFHQNFIVELNDCLDKRIEKSENSKISEWQPIIASCLEGLKERYQKVTNIEELFQKSKSFPLHIGKFLATSKDIENFLDSCQEESCLISFLEEKYKENILPEILSAYPLNRDQSQILLNRFSRKLRKIKRMSYELDELIQEVTHFESEVYLEVLNESLTFQAEMFLYSKFPNYFDIDEAGKRIAMSENFPIEQEMESIFVAFFNYYKIDYMDNVNLSLQVLLDKAFTQKGINGARIVSNEVIRNFFIWASHLKAQNKIEATGLLTKNQATFELEEMQGLVEDCLEDYSVTSTSISVGAMINKCEKRRWRFLSYILGKAALEREISTQFSLQSISANELMNINLSLRKCLREHEKNSKESEGISEINSYKQIARACLYIAHTDVKLNMAKLLTSEAGFSKLVGENDLYNKLFSCAKDGMTHIFALSDLNAEELDLVERLIFYAHSSPTAIREILAVYSKIDYEAIENTVAYQEALKKALLSLKDKEVLAKFSTDIHQTCFDEFNKDRIELIHQGILNAASLESSTVKTKLNESSKEIFAETIDAELISLLVNSNYLLDEKYFGLDEVGIQASTKYIYKKMSVEFLVNTVNQVSKYIQMGFYQNPDEMKAALVVFNSRIKELVILSEASGKPYLLEDFIGIILSEKLFDSLAIAFLSEHLQKKFTQGLLKLRDRQVEFMRPFADGLKEIIEAEIIENHLKMKNAIDQNFHTDRNFRISGLFTSSNNPLGAKIIKLVKQDIIKPMLFSGEPRLESFEKLDDHLIQFFQNEEMARNLFFAEPSKYFVNINAMAESMDWLYSRGRRKDFIANFDSSINRQDYVQGFTKLVIIEILENKRAVFKHIGSPHWNRISIELFSLQKDIMNE